MEPKVSVIVPIYNVENYIERCAESLFSQTLDGLEFLFINDCTPDKSMEVINDYIQKYGVQDKCKMIVHEKNQGIRLG